MGKAGKRKEMVEDRYVQEMHVEVRCVKDFRANVLLVKEALLVKDVCVCVRRSATTATAATQNEAASPGPKRATRPSPVL